MRCRGAPARHRRGEPAHRPWPRLLHRDGRRDLHGRLRAAQVRRRRRPVRRPGERRQDDVPGRRSVLRGVAHAGAVARRRGPVGQPPGAECRAGRAGVGAEPGQRRGGRRRTAGPRHRDRGGGQPAEVRQADPLRRAAWHPVRLVHRGRRRHRPGARYPQRRAGRRGRRPLDATGRRPRAPHPHEPQQGAAVIRTHDAGSLRAEDVGQTVTLAGWVARRRDHGGVAFIDLREASGVVQVVIRDEEVAHQLRAEYCLKVTGQVSARPEGNENPNLPTGDIEVIAAADGGVEVLSAAAALPFPIDEHVEVGEEVRLAYRYLDLRRSGPAAALRLRSEVNRAARDVLAEQGFVEIETPTLTRSTPEGARDFLVPARLQPGSWYALPQSPQLFKQLLMVAGMERYFQIARCYRDEDFRADRQPEFTQLDIEMSFVEQDDVIALAEEVLKAVWALIGHDVKTPIPRMTYADAMARYGSDKPDLRFGLELTDCTDYFKDTPFRVFQAAYVGAVVMPGGASQPRRQFDAWQEWAKQRGHRGLA